jgi:hypothetical protein
VNLILSPTLFAICNRSGAFRRNYRYQRLNVCNVVRSFLYVMLVLNVLLPALAITLVHATFQVPFVMVTAGVWNPYTALDLIHEGLVRHQDFDWTSLTHWFPVISFALGALVTVVLTLVSIVVPIFFGAIFGWKGLKRVFGADKTQKALETALTPLDLGFEWIVAKHDKFCRNIEAKVHKSAYQLHKERIEALMQDAHEHHWAAHTLSKEDLLASIERNRSILSKYVRV